MASIAVFNTMLSPQVRVTESSAGYRVPEIATHQAVYMVMSSTIGDYETPTLVRSLDDFENQFGGSPSESSIKLLFRNYPLAMVYAIRTAIAVEYRVTIDSDADTDYQLTINSIDVAYEKAGAETASAIATALIDAVNLSDAATIATARVDPDDSESLLIRADQMGLLAVAVSQGTMNALDITPLSPRASDYIRAIENPFDAEDEWQQGFLLAPEAFQRLESQGDRLAVGTAMENLAASEGRDWVAIVDVGPDSYQTVSAFQSEGIQYATPQGHLSVFGPYLIDFEGDTVPASGGVVGLALKNFSERGYFQPFAGAKYPLQGVRDVAKRYGRQDQDVLNPLGINVIRRLPNLGVLVWAMRTRSADTNYTFIPTRVVMNVLNGSLQRAFPFELFSSIDGNGVFLSRLEDTARSVCRRMWIAGALFGQTEGDAFQVVCDFRNNELDELHGGKVLLQVYAAPSPALEKLLIGTYRVAIGQVQTAAAAGLIRSAA